MRRTLKFLHTVGGIGMMGAMISLLALHSAVPAPTAVAEYIAVRQAMAAIADWVFMPSLALTILAGLFAIAATRAFQDAGWVWVKLATGVVLFEGSLIAIHGPLTREADLGAAVLAGTTEAAALGGQMSSEAGALWVMTGVAVANVALGVWRPRMVRRKAERAA